MTEKASTTTTIAGLLRTGSRRDFLRTSAFTAVAAGALGACSTPDASTPAAQRTPAGSAPRTPVGAANADSDDGGGTNAPHPRTPADNQLAADAMDAMHEKGVKAFPAKTDGMGNQLLAPRMENGV